MRNIVFIILNTLIIFAPPFRFFTKWTWVIAALGMLCLFDKNVSRKFGFYSKKFTQVVFFIIGMCAFSVGIAAFHSTYDFSYLPLLIGLLLSIFRGVFLIYIFYKMFKEKADFKLYISFFLNSCVVYVTFTLAFIIFPNFKEFWMNNIIVIGYVSDYAAYKFRYGLDGFAAFGTATIFCIAILLNSYLIIKDKTNLMKWIITYIIILSGSFIYGRITIFAIVISIIYMILFCKDKKKLIKTFFIISFIIIIVLQVVLKLSEVNRDVKIWMDWAFEFINNLFSGDVSNTYSVSHMFDAMYFMPNIDTILFGDGRYTAVNGNGYYMSTDVGFMRMILFFGIIGLIVNYSILFIILKRVNIYSRNLKDREGSMLVLSILIATIILEMKGEAFHRVLYCIIPLYFLRYNERFYKLDKKDIL